MNSRIDVTTKFFDTLQQDNYKVFPFVTNKQVLDAWWHDTHDNQHSHLTFLI